MSDTRYKGASPLATKAIGFVEQLIADLAGLKAAGWALRLPGGTPPQTVRFRWGEQDIMAPITRLRADVGRLHDVPAPVCGFEVVLPMDATAGIAPSQIEIFAVWQDGSENKLPLLKVAADGFVHAQRQFAHQFRLLQGVSSSAEDIADLTKLEADKYRKMYSHASYRANPGAPHEARDFFAGYGMKAGDKIIDFGSGPGFASNYFHEQGLRVIAVDIAPNALRDEFIGRFPLIVAAFWDLPGPLDADWGFCTDVMEHIPPDRTDNVLAVISGSVRNSVLFNISLRHDGCGAVINEVLHLSVFPRVWWESKLLTYWHECRFVRGDDNDFACWIVSNPRRYL